MKALCIAANSWTDFVIVDNTTKTIKGCLEVKTEGQERCIEEDIAGLLNSAATQGLVRKPIAQLVGNCVSIRLHYGITSLITTLLSRKCNLYLRRQGFCLFR